MAGLVRATFAGNSAPRSMQRGARSSIPPFEMVHPCLACPRETSNISDNQTANCFFFSGNTCGWYMRVYGVKGRQPPETAYSVGVR